MAKASRLVARQAKTLEELSAKIDALTALVEALVAKADTPKPAAKKAAAKK